MSPMPAVVGSRIRRRKVVFPWMATAQVLPSSTETADQQTSPLLPNLNDNTTETLSNADLQPYRKIIMTEKAEPVGGVPSLHLSLPPIRDLLTTETSSTQDATVEQCLPFLAGTADPGKIPFDFNEFGVPKLDRENHVSFLHDSLERFPANFVGLDASRPWLLYWALTGLSLLGEDISSYRESVTATFAPMQNVDGGFGGGHGQMSHCASSYAAILSLAIVGGHDALSLVNRKTLWEWLGRLKQADGGFQVCEGAEEDVRGAYCAMVMICLLNLPLELPPDSIAKKKGLETFMSGLPEYLSRCQTFEGGISDRPGTEAHGAFAFCALACLCLLGEPAQMIPRYMDVPRLICWLSARQYAPEGGFSGRTNKLVDGCYSHWVGGCWPLIEAALNGRQPDPHAHQNVVASLYSRKGLTRYILCCCQSKRGGLRDKPGKHPDSYHSCYTLAGLSSAQHYHFYTGDSSIQGQFSSAFSWTYTQAIFGYDGKPEMGVFDAEDRLCAIHPLFVIPHAAAKEMREFFNENVTSRWAREQEVWGMGK